jgi:murein DD-endopeptidase MepM/ murein hydrolase activator NlpD
MIHPVRVPVIRGAPDRAKQQRHTWGWVRKNADGTKRRHDGWDYAATPGTECLAISDGYVVEVRESTSYGLTLTLELAGGKRWAFYAHLSEVKTAVGQRVKQGDVVALSGRSGNADTLPASEDHLHFEIRTVRFPGSGGADRISPLDVYGSVPWEAPSE